MPNHLWNRLTCRFFSGFLLFLATTTIFAQQKATSQIRGAIDMSQMTEIEHSTHPLLRKAIDQGELSYDRPMNHMLLVLQPSEASKTALKQLLDDQQNPNSAKYHRWLTAAQFGQQFGPSQQDIQTVSGWLTSQGMTVTKTSAGGGWIDFSGTAGVVNSTFKTSMHRYQISGVSHIANATNMSIPTALTSLVKGVVRLNDIYAAAPIHFSERIHRQGSGKVTVTSYDGMHAGVPAGKSHPAMTDDTGAQYLTPGDLAQIYDTATLNSNGTDGSGASIAVIGRSNVQLSDMRAFRQLFSLPANDPQIILVGPDPGTGSEDEEESALDLEYAGALAPKATIHFVTAQSTDTSDGIDLAATYAVDNMVAPIITLSYGECEAFIGTAGNQFTEALWQQAAAEGISVVVSTGDSGSAGCDQAEEYTPAMNGLQVSGLASTPYNTGVGGTMFDPSALGPSFWSTTNQPNFTTALGYVPEKVWNEACDPTQPISSTGNCIDFASQPNFAFPLLSAGAGGMSSCTVSTETQNADGTSKIECTSGYTKPSWQTGPGVPADGARDIPDVALAAASVYAPYTICVEGSCEYTVDDSGNITFYSATLVGGTSAATPTFASIVALLNQTNGNYQGLLNYKLYQLANAQTTASCNSSAQTNPSNRGNCAFHDITAGTNSVPCTGGTPNCTATDPSTTGVLTGYNAGPGFDLASGLGSVDAANLIAAWGKIATASSVTALQANPTSIKHGQPVQISGAVAAASGTGVPTGHISLQTTSGQAFGPFVLTNGAFSASINSLPGGSYTLAASYPGDATFSSSSSSPINITVSPENSTSTVQVLAVQQTGAVVPGTTSNYGDMLLLRANVAGVSGHGNPTGNVTLLLDGVSQGTFPVTPEGSVELYTGGGTTPGIFPGVGSHQLTASFSGDSSFNASTSSSAAFTVNKGQEYLSLSNTNAYTGQQMFLYAFALTNDSGLPLYPTGTVHLFDNGSPIVTGTLASAAAISSGGSFATIPYTFTTGGTHTITATYNGDANFQAPLSNSPMVIDVTNPTGVPSVVNVATTSIQPILGQGATFSINVAPKSGTAGTHIPTGTIAINGFINTSTVSLPLVYGAAYYDLTFTQAGPTPIYFSYSGDSYYAPSSGAIQPIQVQKITAPPILTLSGTQALPGSQVTVQAVITGSTTSNGIPFPSGQVQFYDSLNGASSVPLGQPHLLTAANGSVAYITAGITTLATNLDLGQHVITAAYLGDTNYSAARSAAATVTISNPDFSLTANPTSVTLATGTTNTVGVQVQPVLGFTGLVSLTCDSSTVPAGVQCTTSSSTVTSGGGTVTVTLAAASEGSSQQSNNSASGAGMLGTSLASGLGIFLIARRKRLATRLCTALLVCGITAIIGCGGGGVRSTTMSLTSSAAKVAAGSTVTYSASVIATGSDPLTGSVTFSADGKTLGEPAALVSGVARLDSNILPVGVHTITASFSGDSYHAASHSGNLLQAITGSTSISLTGTSGSISHTITLPLQLQ